MTPGDDPDDVLHHALDPGTVDQLLRGELAQQDVPPGLSDAASLIRVARGPASAAELIDRAGAVDALVGAGLRRSNPGGQAGHDHPAGPPAIDLSEDAHPPVDLRRGNRLPGPVRATLIGLVAAAALAGAAGAATGAIPIPGVTHRPAATTSVPAGGDTTGAGASHGRGADDAGRHGGREDRDRGDGATSSSTSSTSPSTTAPGAAAGTTPAGTAPTPGAPGAVPGRPTGGTPQGPANPPGQGGGNGAAPTPGPPSGSPGSGNVGGNGAAPPGQGAGSSNPNAGGANGSGGGNGAANSGGNAGGAAGAGATPPGQGAGASNPNAKP